MHHHRRPIPPITPRRRNIAAQIHASPAAQPSNHKMKIGFFFCTTQLLNLHHSSNPPRRHTATAPHILFCFFFFSLHLLPSAHRYRSPNTDLHRCDPERTILSSSCCLLFLHPRFSERTERTKFFHTFSIKIPKKT